MITKNQIKQFIDKSGKLNPNYYKHLQFPTDNIGKYLFDIYNDISKPPICSMCSKVLNFKSFKDGYGEFCSKKCEYKKFPERKKKITRKSKKQFTLEEKSVEYFRKKKNISQLLKPKEYDTISKTEYLYLSTIDFKIPKCENFECDNPVKFLSFEKGFQKTCSSKCAANLKSTINKRKETNLKKYGVEFIPQLKSIQLKIKETKLLRYNDENYNNIEKYKSTCLEKYGVDNIFKDLVFRKSYETNRIESIRNNSSQSNNWVKYTERDNNVEKRKKTSIEKYGVEHYQNSIEFKQESKKITEKIWNTKKKNGTTNTSKIESKIYNLLVNEFGVVKREYKSEKYPFNCDFYIPSIDMYIEYQGFFTHGNGAFLNTPEDIELLEKWNEKKEKSTFYKNAITVWTEKDVKKREIVLANNLKFLEIFNTDDILIQIKRKLTGLDLNRDINELLREYEIIKNKPGNISSPSWNLGMLI